MKHLFVLCLGVQLAVFSLQAQTSAPLRVGVAPVSPPMVYKENGKIVGMEADFAQALGQSLGRPVTFVEVKWEDIIDALLEDKFDIIMCSMSITRGRQFRIAFTDPYLRVGQMALVRADDQKALGALSAGLSGRSVGLRKGTTGDLTIQQEFPRAKRKYYKSDEDGATALAKGRIDLFIDDSSMIWYLAGAYENKGLVPMPVVLTEEVLGWGVKRSDTALLESANAYLKKAQASGELNQTVHRWIPKWH
ncbi:MAG TPA: transporter substrate-binding domain-containing protein [Candidatus Dormibacteraeota bacterium]|nr:transporter substrate-binding domain-containing protein [Candidatus Dormibacteraeota bacterium]